MKRILGAIAVMTVLLNPLTAGAVDVTGNPPRDEIPNVPQPPDDGRALGDVLFSFPDLGMWSVAFRGAELWGVSGSTLNLLNPDTGALIGTLAVTPSLSGTGLGYDASRGLFLVAAAGADDMIYMVNETTGVVASSYASPGSGPVGIAHDTLRDGYWVTDFETTSIDLINPTTGTVVGGCTPLPAGIGNIAGVAYSSNNDRLVFNSRTNGTTYTVEAADCSLVASFPTPGAWGNGIAIRPSDLTIYLRDYTNALIQVVDSGGLLPVELATLEIE